MCPYRWRREGVWGAICVLCVYVCDCMDAYVQVSVCTFTEAVGGCAHMHVCGTDSECVIGVCGEGVMYVYMCNTHIHNSQIALTPFTYFKQDEYVHTCMFSLIRTGAYTHTQLCMLPHTLKLQEPVPSVQLMQPEFLILWRLFHFNYIQCLLTS